MRRTTCPWPPYVQDFSTPTRLIPRLLPMSAIDKSQTRKKTKATINKMPMMTITTTTGTRTKASATVDGSWFGTAS
jgi:hypothetical protein